MQQAGDHVKYDPRVQVCWPVRWWLYQSLVTSEDVTGVEMISLTFLKGGVPKRVAESSHVDTTFVE